MSADLQKRTIVKTLTWRVTVSLTTFIIAWILNGDFLIGVSIGSIEVIAKIFLYHFHERIWNNISWAKNYIILSIILSAVLTVTLCIDILFLFLKRFFLAIILFPFLTPI